MSLQGGTAEEKSSLVANATAEPKDLGSSDVTVAVDVITSLTEEAATDPEVNSTSSLCMRRYGCYSSITHYSSHSE